MVDLNLDESINKQSINTITVSVNREYYDNIWKIILKKYPHLMAADFNLKAEIIDAYANRLLQKSIFSTRIGTALIKLDADKDEQIKIDINKENFMYQKVNKSEFHDAFHKAGRGKQFSYDALNALYDYLEEGYSSDEGYELDVIQLCCSFAEYETLDECLKTCNLKSLEELEEATLVIKVGEGVLIENF